MACTLFDHKIVIIIIIYERTNLLREAIVKISLFGGNSSNPRGL